MWSSPLLWIQIGLLLTVFIFLPLFATWFGKPEGSAEKPKGLNLPKGSVRAMLALLIVGSYANVLVLGPSMGADLFDQVLTAFGTLAGAVTGFYFAGRSTDQQSEPHKPEDSNSTHQKAP